MKISKERLEEIRNFKNKDFSDLPVMTEEQLSKLQPCHLVNKKLWKPQKQTLTMRIDADVLSAMRGSGKGWQTKVNELLRNAVAEGRFECNVALK